MTHIKNMYNIYFCSPELIFTDCYIRNQDDIVKRKILLHDKFDKLDKISFEKAVIIINEQPMICWGVNYGMIDYRRGMIIDELIHHGANPENIIIPYRKINKLTSMTSITNKQFVGVPDIVANREYGWLRSLGQKELNNAITQLYTYYTISFIALRDVNYRLNHYRDTFNERQKAVQYRFDTVTKYLVDSLEEIGAHQIISKITTYDSTNISAMIHMVSKSLELQSIKDSKPEKYNSIISKLRELRAEADILDNGTGYTVIGVNAGIINNTKRNIIKPIAILEKPYNDIINDLSSEYTNITIKLPGWQLADNKYIAINKLTRNGTTSITIDKPMDKELEKQKLLDMQKLYNSYIDESVRDAQIIKLVNLVRDCYKIGIYVRSIDYNSVTFASKNIDNKLSEFKDIIRNSDILDNIDGIFIHSGNTMFYTFRTYKNKNEQEIIL